MWDTYVKLYGLDRAIDMYHDRLDLMLKRSLSADEKRINLEMFSAMHKTTAGRIEPNKLVYPYDMETADKRSELNYYRLSQRFNEECACGIDKLINDSCYETNFCNLDIAAMRAIMDYGFPRVCFVLAFNYQNKGYDGRLSSTNRNWAGCFKVPGDSFLSTWLQAHPILIDGFCGYVRKLHQDLGADCLALPGDKEYGEFVTGYEILRAITTYDDGDGFSTGYAIGHNPKAVSPWVCWQFAVRDGVRHYNWGIYSEDEQTAIDAYNARIFVALNQL